MPTTRREDPEADVARAQAQLFLVQLEEVATQLELQVAALERTAMMRAAKNAERLRRESRIRRLELYEARSQIDALRSRFPDLARPRRGNAR